MAPTAATEPRQFSYANDIALLQRTKQVKPWSQSRVMAGWESVATALEAESGFPPGKRGLAIRARFQYLLAQKNKMKSTAAMRRVGSDEEYAARERLLEEICREMSAHESTPAKGPKTKPAPAPHQSSGNGRESVSSVTGVSHLEDEEEEEESEEDDETAPSSKKRMRNDRGSYEQRKLRLLEKQVADQREHFQQQLALQREQIQLQQQQLLVILDLVQKVSNAARGDTP
ncbi:hypothetical protein Poli38472_014521 [Pythium oligandrum]|uniref:Myb-like domain-containing protein n=2 Tax=Pythiaceae TaxID=4782 RepID=A0A8K1CDB8_PYTOL|nr:hypothetical protein Poli38472_014521 [Pythium oligandrum]DBA02620.1 TPA: hypothetical protein N0F65_011992 [Lagenidium giganteum]|eukprot:TMW61060.1 hypothetical protein Poli38472_014521 [Pythium oligandrum]